MIPARRPRHHLRAASLALLLIVTLGGLVGSAAAVGPAGTGAGTAAEEAGPPAGSWATLADFDDYDNGSLRGQGPWTVNTTGSADGAIASDTAPADFSGKTEVDQLSGFDTPVKYRGNAYAALGDLAVDRGTTATLFLQFQATDLAHTDLHLGLSADPTPGLGMDTSGNPFDLDDFGPEVTLGPSGLVARDGTVDRTLGGLAVTAGRLYRLWIVVDHTTETYRVYAAAPGGQATALTSGGHDSFAFRTTSTDALSTFLQLNDAVDVPSADTYLDTVELGGGALTTDPSPAWAGTATFDNYATGDLGSRSGWTSRDATVVTDPAPAAGTKAGHAVSVSGLHGMIAHDVPAVAPDATGTLFFRVRRTGPVDFGAGLTDVAAPSQFDDLRAQSGTSDGYHYAVRDGDSSVGVGTWPASTWQCFWTVTDHATDRVSLYSRGGPYRTLTRLPAGAARDFGFRTDTTAALDHFLLRTDGSGPVLVDDVAVDPDHTDLSVPGGDAGSCAYHGPASDVPVADPVPGGPQPARLRLGLTEVAQLPADTSSSSGSTPGGARINFTSTMPGLTHATDRLAMPDLTGTLYTVPAGARGASGAQVTPYLDLPSYFPDFVTSPALGTGFGFVAFDPDFAHNGIFYTVHTEAGAALQDQTPTLDSPSDAQVQGVITQWTATDPSAPTFSGTHRQVLRIGFSKFTHGIQEISFDPYAKPGDEDYGLLYIGVGDGDETPVFSGRPQSLSAPQGKLLRIDPAHPADGRGYSIPADNPFVGATQDGKPDLGEIYALGLRNPHRFSWDPADGHLYLGNIGEKRVDSVYQVEPGDNFGWNVREGHFRFDPSDPTNVYPLPSPDTGDYTYPVMEIGRDAGAALVGGFVYRGSDPALRALRGHYLSGDIVGGQVRENQAGLFLRGFPEPAFHAVQLSVGGHVTTMQSLVGASRVDLRFGQDDQGNIYLSSKADGTVWEVTSATDITPSLGSCKLGHLRLRPPATRRAWKPLDPGRWRIGHGQVRQLRPGPVRPGPRRPREYAVLTDGPRLGSFDETAQVRIDRPASVLGRDVDLLLDYRDHTHFAYVHLSNDTHSYAHNGIFVVDGSDRRRIDDQWTGSHSAPAAIKDARWHTVRVRTCTATGRIAVYVDGHHTPLMTATDAFLQHGGRVGFGSFDDYGRLRDLRLRGTAKH